MEASYAFRDTVAHWHPTTDHPSDSFLHPPPVNDHFSSVLNGKELVIQSNEELAEHLRQEREVCARTLEMYRTGQMRFVANHMDTTTYLMNGLQGIINNIDALLERLDDSSSVRQLALPDEPRIFDGT